MRGAVLVEQLRAGVSRATCVGSLGTSSVTVLSLALAGSSAWCAHWRLWGWLVLLMWVVSSSSSSGLLLVVVAVAAVALVVVVITVVAAGAGALMLVVGRSHCSALGWSLRSLFWMTVG